MSSPAVQPILALLACPVGGNPRQYVVEKAFAHLNLDWRFLSVEVAPEGLADAIRGMRAMGFRGGTVADPHRRTILPLLDGTTDTAALLGSVNLVVGEAESAGGETRRLRGDNTEGRGLVESLRRVTDPSGKRCLILDGGELALAVAVELASAGAAEIRIADPSTERAAAAAELLAGKFPAAVSSLVWEGSFLMPEDIDVAVHALSIEPHDAKTHLPVDAASLRPELIVADLAVDSDEAWLLREAAARGCKTIDGVGVLVEQMAVDFRLWTLHDPDRPLMREAVEEFLELELNSGLFITGTDTGVGKTYVAALIAGSLAASGRRVGVYKPAASGCAADAQGYLVSEDAVALWEAAGRPGDLQHVCPQRFVAPLAPHLAARAEGREIDGRLLRSGLDYWRSRSEIVLVEGAGGLMSPLGDGEYVADLAWDLGFPLIVVSRDVLGTINATLQTLITASVYRGGLDVAGVVLNHPSPPSAEDLSLASNRAELAARLTAPLLASVAFEATRFNSEVDWWKLATVSGPGSRPVR